MDRSAVIGPPDGRPRPPTGLSAAQLGELIEELRPLVLGATLIDVAGLPPRDLLLVLERTDDTVPIRRLRVSADPEAARAHLQLGRVKRHDGPTGPFFQRLAELSGARVSGLSQVRGDRILALDLRGAGADCTLLAELTGRHANLVLVDRDWTVLDVLVTARNKVARPRLTAGEPYEPPPGRAGAGTAVPLCEAFPEPEEPAPPPFGACAPLSWRVESHLGGRATEERDARLRKDLRARLKRRLSRARGNRKGLAQRRQAAEGAERVRMDGDLLKSVQHQLARGSTQVEVQDWFEPDGPMRTLPLDPKLGPAENVQRYFDRYRKLKRGLETLAEEEQRAAAHVAALEEMLARIDADDAVDPAELEAEAIRHKLVDRRQESDPRKRKPPAARLPYRTFHTAHGAEVRVGRSARDNDAVTFRHARGNDVWLHTRDTPGSHVVLRVEKGQEPDSEDVLDAAHLAVHFSPLKGAAKASVHVARCKELRKPKGAPAGLVTLAGGKTLHVRMEPERLKRLLDKRNPG